MKATEGINNVDPQFRRNWLESEELSIPKGAYHFFIPGKDAKRQASNFIEIVNLKKGDLPPVLDIEIGRRLAVDKMQSEVKIWLDAVEKKYGVKPHYLYQCRFLSKIFSAGI